MSAQPGNTAPIIRAMSYDDLDTVLEIEGVAYDFPWSRQIFSDCLMAGYLASVLDYDNQLIGYSVLSTAAAEAHILNLCVDPDFQRRGYGNRMLEHLLDYARSIGIERMFLEVRPSNHVAIALYDNAGFTTLGVRKSYYRSGDGREDALVLVREMRSVDGS